MKNGAGWLVKVHQGMKNKETEERRRVHMKAAASATCKQITYLSLCFRICTKRAKNVAYLPKFV